MPSKSEETTIMKDFFPALTKCCTAKQAQCTTHQCMIEAAECYQTCGGSFSESRDPRHEDWKTLPRVDLDLRTTTDDDDDDGDEDEASGGGESVAVFLLLLEPIFSSRKKC